MKKLIALAALSLTLLPVGLASAQDATAAPEVTYEFRDHGVDGTYQRPMGERLHVRRRRGRGSLIQARSHFVPELTASVERL